MRFAAPLLLFTCAALAQSKFEAASVRMGALPQTGVAGMTSGSPGSPLGSPGRFTGRLVSLEQLIEFAYDVRLFQVEGPSWIHGRDMENRFDITAIYDPSSTKEQFRQMMQDLLAERFRLRFHRISKVLPAYELVVANGGPKLKESSAPKKLFTTPTKGGVRLVGAAVQVAEILPFLDPHLDHFQLVDKTGLAGKYDMTLEFAPMSPDQRRIAMELSGITSDEGFVFPSLSTALQEQLGLRLVKGTGSFEMFVVDSADRVPAEN